MTIAGFGLFADLSAPQLEAIVHIFEERTFAEGETRPAPGPVRVGLLRHPRRRGGGRGRRRRSGRGWAAATSSARSRSSSASRRSPTSSRPGRCAASSWPARRVEPFLVTTRGSCTGCSRRRPAGCEPRTDGGAERARARPFPPGDYPVVVIGSGPGRPPGLVLAAAARRSRHAVISADPSPGGMFRRWPLFQRLLSWTKPHAPAPRGSRAYERYDWNSLLARRARGARHPARSSWTARSYFPSRPEMEANLAPFAERAAHRRPLRLPLDGDPPGRGRRRAPVRPVETTDGEYRAETLVVAVGVAEPFTPPGLGMELTHHYAEVRPAETYADRRVLILGKQNSGLRAGQRAAAVGARRSCSPRRRRREAVGRDAIARRRPRPLRPAVRGLTSWAAA